MTGIWRVQRRPLARRSKRHRAGPIRERIQPEWILKQGNDSRHVARTERLQRGAQECLGGVWCRGRLLWPAPRQTGQARSPRHR
jgi:hypothetical protein